MLLGNLCFQVAPRTKADCPTAWEHMQGTVVSPGCSGESCPFPPVPPNNATQPLSLTGLLQLMPANALALYSVPPGCFYTANPSFLGFFSHLAPVLSLSLISKARVLVSNTCCHWQVVADCPSTDLVVALTICGGLLLFKCFTPIAVFSSNTLEFLLCLGWPPHRSFFSFQLPLRGAGPVLLLFSSFFFLLSYIVSWSFSCPIIILRSFVSV